MNVSIRKSKHQKTVLSTRQIEFATKCIVEYLRDNNNTYFNYEGLILGKSIDCDVYMTKTQVSAMVWFS